MDFFQAEGKWANLIVALIILQRATSCLRERSFRISFLMPSLTGVLLFLRRFMIIQISNGEHRVKPSKDSRRSRDEFDICTGSGLGSTVLEVSQQKPPTFLELVNHSKN